MPNPLYVSFVWHMHQPFYKDTETGQYFLPWVRLHAVKDYLHIADILRDYPGVRQTINVVPSLLVQLQDYANGSATDPALEVSQKLTLSTTDKAFLLDSFFSINWDRFVWPVPRYAQLARLRETAQGDVGLLGDRFWLDLIVWFNLAWVDPSARLRDPRLRSIVAKGRDFNRDDLTTVLGYHREACARIIPAYRELAERGQVELSTTPFFHPIVPLLIDTTSAREARSDVPLPNLRFRDVEDARAHLDQAIRFHEQAFGHRPRGIWPAEGGVSQGSIELTSEFPELSWIATDEHILERALETRFQRDGYGHLEDPSALCQPYRIKGFPTAVFFRDQTLSDRIGFAYQHMESGQAAGDLVDRLLTIWQKVYRDTRPRVVSIILDGENCWESYPNNGDDFLRALFERLSHETRLQTITPAQFLDRFGVISCLDRLPSGSWIGANFDTWIGERDQNRAWDLLAFARARLTQWERENQSTGADASTADEVKERLRRAQLALMVAQGSDWFWWYYSHNRFGNERAFDVAFRRHLANVYRAIGAAPPEWLDHPIDGNASARQKAVSGWLTISRLSSTPIATDEWAGAGFVEPGSSTGAMQAGMTIFRRMYFGCDRDHVFVRLEMNAAVRGEDIALYVGGNDTSPGISVTVALEGVNGSESSETFQWKLDLSPQSGPTRRVSQARDDLTWEQTAEEITGAFGESVVEIEIGRSVLGLGPDAPVRLLAVASRDGGVVEVLPTTGSAMVGPPVSENDRPSIPGQGPPTVLNKGEQSD